MNFPKLRYSFIIGLLLSLLVEAYEKSTGINQAISGILLSILFFGGCIWATIGFKNLWFDLITWKTYSFSKKDMANFYFPAWGRMFLVFLGAAIGSSVINALK